MLHKRVVRRLGIEQRLEPNSVFHARQLTAAHTVAQQVDSLIRDAALLKVALGLFCVEAF